MTIRLLVAYDGTNFSGFQVQPTARTVQGVLQYGLERIAKRPVTLRGAGRTDAGVHALGQVVTIDDAAELHPDLIMRAMPSVLPNDVAVVDAQTAPEGFDARFSARWRSYTYLLWTGLAPNPLYQRYALWSRTAIDTRRLREALKVLVGRHDFTSFGRIRRDQTPERRLIGATAVEDGPFIRIRVVGESFLHQMVRSIVGTALEVGTGRKPVGFMSDALAARDRAAAGPVAPPHALALTDVGYEDAPWPRRDPTPWPWSDRVVSHSERGCA